MSRFGDDGIDFSDAFDRLVPSAAAAAAAPKPAAPRFAPNVSAGRPPPSRAGVGHPPPGGFGGPAAAAAAAPPAALGFMSRPRPPVSAAAGGAAQASSLPPQPAWLQRAYNAPASSPLATHRQATAAPAAAAATPVRPNTSPHFANGGGAAVARTNSFGGGGGGSAHPPPQQPSGNGVRFTTGSSAHTSQNGAGGVFRNGVNQTQQRSGSGAGSFQSTYGYQSGGQQRAAPAAASNGRGQGWSAARPVAFPANFNPNAAPALPPTPASLAPGSGSGAAAGSRYRTMYEPAMSDVPKGRGKKKELGIPLPDYLQQYAHLPRNKLPDSLSSDERSLLRAERKRQRVHDAELSKSLSESRKQAELIDLDAYSAEVQRERKGWNSQRIKVSFQLCSADRVAVETNPRNEMRIVHMVQSVQGAAFDRNLASSSGSGGAGSKGKNNDGFGSKGLWTIPISAYDAALARLVGLRSDHLDIVIVPVDASHLRALRGESALQKQHTSFESMRGIPPALAASLYPFQREGVEYCVNHEGRAMIGDEMGLGKSIQAIAVAAYYSDDWPLLIVCPSSLRLTWKNELLKWLGISSLRESDILEVSSGEDDDADEGRIPDDFGSDGEAEWAPQKGKTKSQITDEDFLDDEEDFEQLLAATSGGAAAKRGAKASKPAAKPAARAASPLDDDDEDVGESEYQPPTTRRKGASSRGGASKKRRRAVSDSDEEEDEVEIADSDASWDEEEDNASEEEEEAAAEDDEAYEPEPVVTRKKPPKRRRIIDDSDEEEEEAEVEPAAAAAVKEEVDEEAEEDAPIVKRAPAAAPLTPKEAFKAKLASQRGGVRQPAPVSKPAAAAPAAEDAELQESLRLIAEMEEREAAKQRAGPVKTEPGVQSVKAEAQAVRVKAEPPSSVDDDDVVDMCVDADEVGVKAEPKAESQVKTEAGVKAEPAAVPVVAPYVSAASLITSSFLPDEMRVKTEPQFAPAIKKPAPPMPSPRSSPTASSSAAVSAAASAAASAASSSSAAAFAVPVKPSSSSSASAPGPSFRPLTKNNIHVILTGKAPLMGPASSQTRVVIISYDLVAKYTLALQRQNFQFIIADESHYVKNATAKRSQALLPLMESAKRVLCLSGTPAMSRPYELYAQINALRPTVFGSAHAFGTRYCAPTKGFRGKIEYKGAQNLVELHMLLKKYVLVRRLKEDVLKDLRPKTRTAIVTSVHNKALADSIRQIANLKQIVAAQLVDGARPNPAAAMAAAASAGGPKKQITQLYADTGLAKLPFILSYLQDLLEAGTKFLIFAHHLAVLDGIEQCLIKEKAGYFRLDGSTKPADRQAGVEKFQSDRKSSCVHERHIAAATCRVALLSITAGGTGITLTAASTVVFAELQWTPALLCQAEDRVHRIGQFNPVNIYYIVAHHTLDEILWPMLSSKLEVLGNTLNGREDALAVAGVQGDSAMHTPITFKKVAASHEPVDLTEGDGDDEKVETSRPMNQQQQQQQRRQQLSQADSFRSSIKAEESSPAAAAAAAPKAAVFSGWIGMSGGGAKKEPIASAPKPVVSLAAQLAASDSVARLLQRDASLDAELQSSQQEQRMARSVQEDVERFRLPVQEGERALRNSYSHSQSSAALAEAASQVAPPPGALISLEIADSDADYASDEEEEDPDVFDTAAARKQLARARQQQ